MRIYFAGAESPSHLKLLRNAGVERVAINVTHQINRMPKSADWSLQDAYPAPLEVCLYPNPADDDWDRYRAFLDAQPGASMIVGPTGIEWEDLEGFIPLWDGSVKMVNGLCERWPIVAASEKPLRTAESLRRLKTAAMHHGTRLVAVGATRSLLKGRWEAAVVSSWQSPQRYGETQVWDGRELHRYGADQKAEVRHRHRADIERLGVDPDAVEADDKKAVLTLAVKSWLALEKSTQAPEDGDVVAMSPETHPGDSQDQHPARLPMPVARVRHERLRTVLPVMDVEAVTETSPDLIDGETGELVEVDTGRTKIRIRGETMRVCDTCMLAQNCPGFEVHTTCAYSIPIVARTKDDLVGIMDGMVEMQAQRIMFARFAEEIEGQGLDPAVGAEMDRLFKIMATKKDILDERDVFRLEMEARGSAGAISRIFGESAGVQLRQLSTPLGADRVIDVLDRVDR